MFEPMQMDLFHLEALKSIISVIFAHVAPDRCFDLQGCETRMTAICL